jgi:pimeloyl-ACP methyl ester carboxylesterase
MLKRSYIQIGLVWLLLLLAAGRAGAQRVPYLSELFSRYEEFNRLLNEKKRAGFNTNSIEAIRKKGEEAFRRGNIPAIIEAESEAIAALQGKPWDDRQRFLASLTLEINRGVLEPNSELQISLSKIFPAAGGQTSAAPPTVTFEITEAVTGNLKAAGTRLPEPLILAQRVPIAEFGSNASRRLRLIEGQYWVVARIESGNEKLLELRRPIFAINSFSDTVAELTRMIAAINSSTDGAVKSVAPLMATPEFQLHRLSLLNSAPIEDEINPIRELAYIRTTLAALAKGRNPFERERGEVERAYRSRDGNLVPYRIYVPANYDGGSARPLVVMLHGALGDERYYFSGLFDPEAIRSESERRGWILVGVNGRGRFSGYRGAALDDTFEVIAAVSREYRVDSARIYLTGHSMGGYGAWLIASRKPSVFAAVAPVSGGSPVPPNALPELLAPLKSVPVLIVHGARDGIVTPDQSHAMLAAAQKAGLNATYLEAPDADHLTILPATFGAILDFFDKNSKPADK